MGRRYDDDDDRSEKDAMWEGRDRKSRLEERPHYQPPAQEEPDFTPSRKDLDIMNSGKLGPVVIIPDKGLARRLEDLHDQVIDGKILLSPKLADAFTMVYGVSPKERNYFVTFVTQSEVRDGYLRTLRSKISLNDNKEESLDSRLDDSEE
jgi:hypothetical protein